MKYREVPRARLRRRGGGARHHNPRPRSPTTRPHPRHGRRIHNAAHERSAPPTEWLRDGPHDPQSRAGCGRGVARPPLARATASAHHQLPSPPGAQPHGAPVYAGNDMLGLRRAAAQPVGTHGPWRLPVLGRGRALSHEAWTGRNGVCARAHAAAAAAAAGGLPCGWGCARRSCQEARGEGRESARRLPVVDQREDALLTMARLCAAPRVGELVEQSARQPFLQRMGLLVDDGPREDVTHPALPCTLHITLFDCPRCAPPPAQEAAVPLSPRAASSPVRSGRSRP